MWTNHQYLKKYVGRIQNLCNSAKSVARRKKSTWDCKISKSAQVPGLSFEESFELKPGCWVGKINTNKVFWPPKNSGFCGLATQNTAKITQDWWRPTWRTIGPRKSGLAAQNLYKKCLLASQEQWILWPGHPKHSKKHPGLAEVILKDHWSKVIWPPSWKDCNPLD